jgi:hypothetical protein
MRKASLHPPAASDGNGFSVGGCGKEESAAAARKIRRGSP